MIEKLKVTGAVLILMTLMQGCGDGGDRQGKETPPPAPLPGAEQPADTTPQDTILEDTLSAPTGVEEAPPDPGGDRSKAPGFSLPDLSGRTHELSDYRGKVVVIDFWATWCPPCRKEIPHLIELYEQKKKQGLLVLGVGIDKKEGLARFAKQQGISYPVLVDEDKKTVQLFGIRGIPRTLVVDKKGRIAFDHTGFAEGMEEELASEVQTLLAEQY